MWVVKLGGSLYQKSELQQWLKQLTILSHQHPIVIVPGGGPFADQVRQAQQFYAFSDQHAHHMALLAMAQFGITLLDLTEHAHTFYYPNPTSAKMQPLSIWLPNERLLDQASLQQNWTVTSDSLALWLAYHLGAKKLLLVKQVMPNHELTITQLSEQGIIDEAFPDLFSHYPVATTLAKSSEYNKAQSFFSAQTLTL